MILGNKVLIQNSTSNRSSAFTKRVVSDNTIFDSEVVTTVTDEEIIVKRADINSKVSRKAVKSGKVYRITVTSNIILEVGSYDITTNTEDLVIINIKQ